MKKVLIGLIHFYQRAISAHTPPSCRFVPTCSAYAIEAIQRFGAFKGTALAVWRILRCNPLCKGRLRPGTGEKDEAAARPQAGVNRNFRGIPLLV